MYIKHVISNRIIEIPEIKQRLCLGAGSNVITYIGLIIGFVQNPTRNSRWYNADFTTQSEKGI
jgi:hypothetical protein